MAAKTLEPTQSLFLSLSLALIDTVKGPGTGNMSLGIIQRERTAYGRVRTDERGGGGRKVEGTGEGEKEIHSNVCQVS